MTRKKKTGRTASSSSIPDANLLKKYYKAGQKINELIVGLYSNNYDTLKDKNLFDKCKKDDNELSFFSCVYNNADGKNDIILNIKNIPSDKKLNEILNAIS